jgi:hypothetical protein
MIIIKQLIYCLCKKKKKNNIKYNMNVYDNYYVHILYNNSVLIIV